MSGIDISRRGLVGSVAPVLIGTSILLTNPAFAFAREDEKRLPPSFKNVQLQVLNTAPRITGKIPLNLFLCLDVSESMWPATAPSLKPDNVRLQREGTAAALEDEDVCALIEHKGGIGITACNFADGVWQSVPWTFLRNKREIKAYAQLIRQAPIIVENSPEFNGTGQTYLSDGLSFVSHLVRQIPNPGLLGTVVDISGDGTNDSGEGPVKSETLNLARQAFTQVNGLAITDKNPGLKQYFEQTVVTPDVFDETGVPRGRTWVVHDMADFKQIMIKKLKTEIAANEWGNPPARHFG